MSVVNLLVEGDLDEVVADRLLFATGHQKGQCFPKHGWTFIRNNCHRYNQAAHHMPCLTLVDAMDTKIACPGDVLKQWLPNRHPDMIFRVVVREIESWLLADAQGIARLFGIDVTFLPASPEQVSDPKRELVGLARRSRTKRVREDFVPRSGSTAQVGPLYVSELTRFVQTAWDVEEARQHAPSLDRCLQRLRELK